MQSFADRIADLSRERLTLLALSLREKLHQSENARREPIAVVGLGCRFPDAPDPESFWQLLAEGRDAIRTVPADRFDVEQYYDPSPQTPGKMYTRHAGFVEGINLFDPNFFGISPREALSMDPQQRLLLEVCWEALENAGQAPGKLAGSPTGAFIGISTYDYLQLSCRHGALDQINAYTGTGCSYSIASGRLSYVLGLQGPNFPVDTACSSSLVAVHLACQSLRNRECKLALAGGVNALLAPDPFIYFCKVRALSPDGACKTFDASANGYVRGEGCGIVVLKLLSEALEDGDRILAVIRGTAVNHDGRTSGLTVPNQGAQEAVLRSALASAGLSPQDVDYVEAHGTGTPLGDPIELQGLGAVYGDGRSPADPLLVGTVKTNIGHLEAAAGIAGLIKVILALNHQQLPPHLHLQQPTPLVSWKSLPLEVVTRRRPWPERDRPRRAGVSSFGFSGTNAHILVEAPPLPVAAQSPVVARSHGYANGTASTSPIPERPLHILCLSAKDPESLHQLSSAYARTLIDREELALADAAYTANAGRSHFAHRLTVTAGTSAEAAEALARFAEGQASEVVAQGQATIHPAPRVAFLFTGQGVQYAGMGRRLFETQPTFRQTLQRCDELLRPLLDRPLLSLLYPDPGEGSLLDETAYTQPALFALEYALAETWRSWGVEPTFVLGHSVGQYVAACVAGVFSLEDGLKLIVERARLMQSLPHNGGMAVVFASEEVVAEAIGPFAAQLAIAAVNGPNNVVISGGQEALQVVLSGLGRKGITVQPLRVSHAFHSPLLEPILDQLEQGIGSVSLQAPRYTLVCNVTGQLARASDLTSPRYWSQHARQPVRFADSIRTLNARGCDIFVEVGPHPTLLSMARQCVAETSQAWIPTLRRQAEDWTVLLDAVRQAYLRGVPIDWKGFDRDYSRKIVSLPTYAFKRQLYKLETKTVAAALPARSEPVVPVVEARPETAADWYYDIAWEPKLFPKARGTGPGSRPWLLLTDGSSMSGALAERLTVEGSRCLRVVPGKDYARTGDLCTINPLSGEDWDRLLKEVATVNPEGLQGIAHLWSLSCSVGNVELEAGQELGCGAVLYLAQSVLRHYGTGAKPPLWMITRGAQPVPAGSAVPGLVYSTLWGLGQVLAVEQPRWRCALVDLDPAASAEDSARHLGAVLLADETEHQHALRDGQRYVARLNRRRDLAGRGGPAISGEATYLITGGLGGLGLLVARWLAEQGARHLVLVGRRAPQASSLEALVELQQFGAKVCTLQADVTQSEDVARLLQHIDSHLPPLRGVIHAAGLYDAALVDNLEWNRFTELLRPKTLGAWHLHEQTRQRPLDFFVLFSSMASVLPSPGQGHYAAANAFLDALAHQRRSENLPALSINWGPWAEVGMAERLTGGLRRRWKSLGLPEIETAGGLAALGELLAANVPQAAVMPIEWNKLFNTYPAGLEPPLLARIAEQERRLQPPSPEWQRLAAQLRKLPPAEKDALLTRFLQERVAPILGLDPAQPIPLTVGFFELGMDSLMAVELRNRLQADLGHTHALPVTLVFDAPNLRALGHYLRDKVLAAQEAEETAGTEPIIQSPEPARPTNEPIAVIGYACRLPGGVVDGESFWRLLRDGVDAIREVPPDRWDIGSIYDPNPDAPGKMYSKHGGFLEGIDQFDASFFGIAPREAMRMDPQHRLLLEVAWEALENSHQPADRLANTSTAVYVGISGNDYVRVMAGAGDLEQIDAYLGVGNALSIAAGRLSYFLGLRGPCMAVDTACSSSLVAVHLACESLRADKARMALAGGVNLILTPEATISLCKARMMAPDGRCKTFDAFADGYVRAEGCVLLVLKRLSDAQADGDRVLAVIRGTAANHDGRTSGLTVPSGAAQEELLRHALADAGVAAHDIDFVETHGTGTPLGDPIEVRALGEALTRGRPQDRPLRIGALKTNVGHLESAAGAAGLLKMVLCLQHGQIPANLHLRQPSPYIPWHEYPIEAPTELSPWTVHNGPRRGGVSAFGFSGTNAHVIVEEAPAAGTLARAEQNGHSRERPLHFLCLSARQPVALQELSAKVAQQLRSDPSLSLADVCHTLNAGRAHLGHRLALVAASGAEAVVALEAAGQGKTAPGLATAQRKTADAPRIAFLFAGQSTHYPGMARQLYETQPTFRKALKRCADIIDPLIGKSLLSLLHGSAEEGHLLDQTGYAQPALFALEYAQAQMWLSWGIDPGVVVGHSVGEYAAACVAGALSLEEGLRLIVERAQLMQSLPGGGAMAAVFASADQAAAAIPAGAPVSVACLNGPHNTVLSGERTALDAILNDLTRQGVRHQLLNVSHAFHSPLMDPILGELEKAAGRIVYKPFERGLICNLTGDLATEPLSADYWRRHAREPVQFTRSMAALAERGYEVFLEIGPGSTLLGLVRQCLPDAPILGVSSLRRGSEDLRHVYTTLQSLYLRGAPIDWKGFDQPYHPSWVDLPTYPFQKTRYWIDSRPAAAPKVHTNGTVETPKEKPASSTAKQPEPTPVAVHSLLGQRLRSPVLKDIVYQNRFHSHAPAFLDEHRIYSMVVVPGACHLSMLLLGLTHGGSKLPLTVADVSFPEALILPEGETRLVQLILSPHNAPSTGNQAAAGGFQVLSAGDDEENPVWTLHAGGTIPGTPDPEAVGTATAPAIAEIQARCPEVLPSGRLIYQLMYQQGLQLGTSFQWIDQIYRSPVGEGAPCPEALARLRLPRDASESDPYVLHPGLLDSCFQTIGATFTTRDQENSVYIPVNIERLIVHRRPTRQLWNHARLRPSQQVDGQMFVGDLTIFDVEGALVLEIQGLRVRRAPRSALMRFARRRLMDDIFAIRWQEAPLAETAASPTTSRTRGPWILFADRTGLADTLARELRSRGEACQVVFSSAPWEGVAISTALPVTDCRGIVFLRSIQEASSLSWSDVLTAQEDGSRAILELTGQLAKLRGHNTGRLYLVTRGTQGVAGSPDSVNLTHAPLWGLRKVLALEHPPLRPVCIDLPVDATPDDACWLAHEILADDREDQVAYRRGKRLVARLVHGLTAGRGDDTPALPVPTSEPYRLLRSEQGLLSGLHVQVIGREPPQLGEVEIEVHATGLNFRDVLNALGVYPGDAGPLGGECAGTITALGEGVSGFRVGDRVVAIGTGTFSRYVLADARMVVPLPESLGFEEGTTVPVTFVTAELSLNELAQMKAGDKVLIHAAAGGVGLAAVQLALRAGAEIYATAGSPAKRAYLRELGVQHIFDSRSLSFAEGVLVASGGRGVDIVLNSLAGDFITTSFAVLAPKGRFIEIGKRDIWDQAQVEMVRPDVTYHTVALDQLIVHQPGYVGKMLAQVMRLLQEGAIKPLPMVSFPLEQASTAFRFMARAGHTGKIVVVHPVAEAGRSKAVPGAAGAQIRGDAIYLITGGLGGLGLLTASWLVDRGARHLVLMSRRAPSLQAQASIADLEKRGATVRFFQGDVSREEDVERMMGEVEAGGRPVRGIFHAAGLLDDGILVRQSWDRFVNVYSSKVGGALNLHQRTKEHPVDLFVLYSSAAAVLGFPSQGSYAAANAFLDSFAHHRRRAGLPAQAINWGPWAEVGMAAAASEVVQQQWASSGIRTLPPSKGIALLDMLVEENVIQAAVLPIEWPRLLAKMPPGSEPPLLSEITVEQSVSNEPSKEWQLFAQTVADAPPAERREMVMAHLQAQAGRVLGMPLGQLPDPFTPLSELGFDSLLAVEWANQLGGAAGIRIQVTLLFDYPTLDALAGYVLRDVLKLEAAAPAPAGETIAPADNSEDLLASIENMSDEELDKILGK